MGRNTVHLRPTGGEYTKGPGRYCPAGEPHETNGNHVIRLRRNSENSGHAGGRAEIVPVTAAVAIEGRSEQVTNQPPRIDLSTPAVHSLGD